MDLGGYNGHGGDWFQCAKHHGVTVLGVPPVFRARNHVRRIRLSCVIYHNARACLRPRRTTMPQLTETIGAIAAVRASLSYPPQVRKAWPRGPTDGLSLGMLTALTIGLSLWVLYGALRGDWVIVLANVAGATLAATVLGCKIRDRHDADRPPGQGLESGDRGRVDGLPDLTTAVRPVGGWEEMTAHWSTRSSAPLLCKNRLLYGLTPQLRPT